MGDDQCLVPGEYRQTLSTESGYVQSSATGSGDFVSVNVDTEHVENGHLTEDSLQSEDLHGRCVAGSHGSGVAGSHEQNSSRDSAHGNASNTENGTGQESNEGSFSNVRSSVDNRNNPENRNSLDSKNSLTRHSLADESAFMSGLPAISCTSFSDIMSVSSLSSCQSLSRDTITSRKRFELRHGNHHDNEVNDYLTPLQRKDRELKDLRRERLQLLRESQEKDSEMSTLKKCLEACQARMYEDKAAEMADIMEKLRASEKEKFEEMEQLVRLQEELAHMDSKYTELKRKMSEREERFEEYLFDMYRKGQQAAMFEREEELEMLASSQKARVSVRELTRKLSRTEMELAKWQGMKLEESYSTAGPPSSQAEATLSFLKDSFFHFITSKTDNEDHLRAMITIFNYPQAQMDKIRKSLDEVKRLDRKRLSLK